jgi:hypothetical protein
MVLSEGEVQVQMWDITNLEWCTDKWKSGGGDGAEWRRGASASAFRRQPCERVAVAMALSEGEVQAQVRFDANLVKEWWWRWCWMKERCKSRCGTSPTLSDVWVNQRVVVAMAMVLNEGEVQAQMWDITNLEWCMGKSKSGGGDGDGAEWRRGASADVGHHQPWVMYG